MPALRVAGEVLQERERQDKKWGEQNHEDGKPSRHATRWANYKRGLCDYAAKQGRLTWRHILAEEFAEAEAALGTPDLREELVQVAAVAVAWIECIDRRKDGTPERNRSL